MKDNSPEINSERSIDKLARYILGTAATIIICLICWYFKDVLIYIIMAAVVALIGRPIMTLFKKIKIKGKSIPPWLLAIITEILILFIFITIVTQIIPVVYSIIAKVSNNLQNSSLSLTTNSLNYHLYKLNEWFINTFPNLDKNFKLEKISLDYIRQSLDMSSISAVLGSVASFVINIAIGIFSVVFISFFFIRDDHLFKKIIAAIIPSQYEETAIKAISDIEHLLSRYFLGLICEIFGVVLLNFIGLCFIVKLGFAPALGIAFISGLLNIIPYVGPWIGAILGVCLGVILKLSTVIATGVTMNIGALALIILAIFIVTQLVDNFLYQPFIYSTSIKASPLEIFIVLLIAGHIGGMLGMLIAIPSYTAIRVIASRFFYNIKAIKKLIPDRSEEEKSIKDKNVNNFIKTLLTKQK